MEVWGEEGICQDQLGPLLVVPLWARPQTLKWLGLCFGERLGAPPCLRLGGLAAREDVGSGGWGVGAGGGVGSWGEGSCVTPHVMRSTSAARQCRVLV